MNAAASAISFPAETPAAQAIRCAHCAQPVASPLVEAKADHQFCCAGCRAVFETLTSCGLEAYYRLRDATDAKLQPANVTYESFAAFDSPTFHDRYVETRTDGLASVDLVLEGVSCAACVWLVERLPRVVPGVAEARLSLTDAAVRVVWDPAKVKLSQVAHALDRVGYAPHPARGQSAKDLHRRETRRRLIHLGVAGAIMGNCMLLAIALYCGDAGHMDPAYRAFFRWGSAILGVVSLAWPGATFFRSAIAALRMRTTNLDVPIALALLVGGVAGLINVVLGRGEIYFDSLAVLVFLLLVGRFIQYRQQRRADDAVGLLFNLTPSSCRIVAPDGSVTEAPIDALKIGDLVEVRAGDLFPADGLVESGLSAVDQALLTGESAPVAVAPGAPVHAGSQNVASALRVRIDKVGSDTRVGQLMRLVARGVQDKPQIVQFADRVGRVFIVVLTLVAAAVFGFWSRTSLPAAIDHTVALLIVTCPCVLGLATPLTIAIAIGRLARRDILVKSGAALERLSRGGNLLLDKTGTLTEGKLQLLEWAGDESVKGVVAEIERNSNHPVGRALRQALAVHEPDAHTRLALGPVTEKGDGGATATLHGHTIRVGSPRFIARANVNIPTELQHAIDRAHFNGLTAIVIAQDDRATAIATLGDRLRPGTKDAVGGLERLGFTPSILSGDNQGVVHYTAAQIDIPLTRAFAQMLPEEKLHHVRTAHVHPFRRDAQRSASDARGLASSPRSNLPTIMVGDGVNDAAALAAADVGIAVHGGAEASLAAADIYIARPGLDPLIDLARMARRAMRTVHRNLVVSLSYNVLAGALAAAGVMTPLLAAIIMPISSATVLSLAVWSISRNTRRDLSRTAAPTGGPSWK